MATAKAESKKTQASAAQDTAAKSNDSTNASMKGAQESASGTQASQANVGSVKDQVTALINVYTDQASEKDNNIVNAIAGFFKNLWSGLKSIFSKKEKEQTGVVSNLTKAEVLAKLVETFECSDNLAEIAKDKTLMRRIMTELPAPERNSALDCLYDQVDSVDLLIEMLDLRFGVPVINSGDEASLAKVNASARSTVKNIAKDSTIIPWSSAALHEVYTVYINLPQKDLDLITCLLHTDDTTCGGAAYGTGSGTTGVYYVDYYVGNERKMEVYKPEWNKTGNAYGHSDNSSDRRSGTIMMDMTTAHELGHIVDGNSGWKLSGKGSKMRDVNKWVEYDKDPATVVSEMTKSISGTPYDGKLNDDELKVVKTAAELYLARSADTFAGKWDAASTAMEEDINTAAQGKSGISADSIADIALDEKIDTSLLHHIWRGQAGNSSHYNHTDAMRGMSRPLHQGYNGQGWFTFNIDAWNDKISCYQFRCPKEEFAETYASYHAAPAMGKKKGEMTPEGLLKWFKEEGLADAETPDSGSSGASEEA